MGKGKAYINLVDKNLVAVVDTKTMTVVDKWPPLPAAHLLAVSMIRSRAPAYLLDVEAAEADRHGCRKCKILADLPIGAGVDATN